MSTAGADLVRSIRRIAYFCLVLMVVACGDFSDPPAKTPTTHDAIARTTSSEPVSTSSTRPIVPVPSSSVSTEPPPETASTASPYPEQTLALPEPLSSCEALPTVYDLVAFPPGDPPVEVFDLATEAGVTTFRVRSTGPIPLTAEYRDGVTHYTIPEDPDSEWLVGPASDDIRVLRDGSWVKAGEMGFMPWIYADPSVVYGQSITALSAMHLSRWEPVGDSRAAVFTGVKEAVDAYIGEDSSGLSDPRIEIWFSLDCYPVRVDLEATPADGVRRSLLGWEVFDLGEPVTFDIPGDMQGN